VVEPTVFQGSREAPFSSDSGTARHSGVARNNRVLAGAAGWIVTGGVEAPARELDAKESGFRAVCQIEFG